MKNNNNKGFSLIELMIVVAIVGILAAIAYPSYQDQMRSGRRSDGQAELLRIQTLMERHYYDNGTYAVLSGLTAFSTNIVDSPEDFYKISVVTATATCPIASCYVLQAVAQGTQTADGNLTLSSTGIQTGNW